MKNNVNELFEAFHNDASRISPLPIVLPGYYYIGAVYPTDVVTGKRIALALLSQQEPFFKSKTIIKLDLSNLYRYSAISESKHLSASALVGSIIQITGSEPIITDYYTFAWQIRWNIFKQITNPKRFLFELESDKQTVLQKDNVKSSEPSINEAVEIPEEDIQENSFEEELEIPDEIEDEQFLEELDQLLYDQQISVDGNSYMNEVLQLLWDEQREDRPDNGFENQEEGI